MTANAVKACQIKVGVSPANGVVAGPTWKKLIVQVYLNKPPGNGPLIPAAVKAVQKEFQYRDLSGSPPPAASGSTSSPSIGLGRCILRARNANEAKRDFAS